MNLAAAGALMGDGDPGRVVASLPGKTVWEGAHRNGLGDLFLVYVLKTSSVQSLPLWY